MPDPVVFPATEKNLIPLEPEGDTLVIKDLLTEYLAEGLLEKLLEEVEWETMEHGGRKVSRMVALQADIDRDGTEPLYRYPTDEMHKPKPWTETMRRVRDQIEEYFQVRVNQAKIQLYRDGESYINYHSDKTLDIDPNSRIINLSLGATRTFYLRSKEKRADGQQEVRGAELPHNSVVAMGLKTNREWHHGVPKESGAGPRISIVFRTIATFRRPDGTIIGQGAPAAGVEPLEPAVEKEKLRMAFREENRAIDFDWKSWYGNGFATDGLG